jgi:WD40 repeat protein
MTTIRILAVAFILSVINVFANDASIWSVNSKAEVLRGDARSVSIDSSGNITLAPKLTEVYKTEQPYIWSSVADNSGNLYLGTGGDGKIFKVTANGTGSLLSDLTELNVSALAIASDGSLFAGTSPDGKVYRVDSAGKTEVYFEPKEKYIWSLAVMSDGSLAVGTGENGRIYKVKAAKAAPESSILFDTSETHITTLAVDKNGDLIAGTDSGGLVLKFNSAGKPFALLDSPLREIHQLAIGPDGSIYALAIADSAATAIPPTPQPPATTDNKPTPAIPTPEPPQRSRYDLAGAKSVVYRILPDGGSDILWASNSVTAFSIYAHQTGSGVLIGTGDKGRIYNISNDARDTLVLQSDANQISTIRSVGGSLYATSSNQGRLFKFGGETVAEGMYESSVLDAKAAATWGRLWWRSTGNVQIQTRSGNTETANETWSEWANVSGPNGGPVASPKARFLQWRAVLKSGPTPPVLNEASVAYLARNIAPEILSITDLPANVGLAPNPPIQIDPNILASGLEPSVFGIQIAPVPPRRIFQRGAHSFQWTAEDRNGDRLVYDLYFKEVGDANYKLLREDIFENFATIDGLSLADGRYTFKVVAKDSPGNPADRVLTGERISEPFDVDNTQPTVTAIGSPQITDDTARIAFLAADKSSWINRAEYSIDGGEWHEVFANDGISDSPNENYTVNVTLKAPGEYAITIRVYDAAGNAGTARVLVRR